MKTITTIVILMISYSHGFCQKQPDSTSVNLKNKVAGIDAYINQIDKNSKLYSYTAPLFEQSIYTKTIYNDRNAPYNTLKLVRVAQNATTYYYKDKKKVYTSVISSMRGNYSNINNVYLENDSIIYSYHQLCEEHISQIQYSYDGARGGGSFTLTINKDSIKFSGNKKISVANTSADWNKLMASFNLTNFDKIQTTGFRAYIDGSDWSYVITTDRRTHSFVNAPFNDPEKIKMSDFFSQINLLISSLKNSF